MKRISFLLLILSEALVGQAPLEFNATPARVVGQLSITSSARNLVEGRELFFPQAVTLDTTVTPPRVYVADTVNNRVLGWQDAYNFANGAKADIVIGQRNFEGTANLFSGAPPLSSGLSSPTGLAVDRWGHLWVADSGNNRIVRYKAPFSQPDVTKVADFVLGQAALNTRVSNLRLGDDPPVNARGIATITNQGPLICGLHFDPAGNLWFADGGNNRVLRYPADRISDSAFLNPDAVFADLVLGQANFNTNSGTNDRTAKSTLVSPSVVVLDGAGNAWVGDDGGRVLVYRAPLFSGKAADRIMGVPFAVQGQPPPPAINEIGFRSPTGIFFIRNIPFVVDRFLNRILRFDPLDQWPPENLATPSLTSLSPPARAVIGQDNFNTGAANRAATNEANPSSFAGPTHAMAAPNGEVFIVDSGNHRVVVMPDPSNGPASAPIGAPYEIRRVLGQDFFHGSAPNLIEGREMNSVTDFTTGSASLGMGMAIDTRGSTPRLYVADTGNNRILAYADARRVRFGDRADRIIGQVDGTRRLINSPTNDSRRFTATGLAAPTSVAVDSEGNLWVADFGNGRVLRFPRPFEQQGAITADMVLGQTNLTSRLTDPSSRVMGSPYGLAFSQRGALLVTDVQFNRALYFEPPFTNGQAATKVLGQTSFDNSTAGAGPNGLNQPYGVAFDTSDRVYLADFGNNRVLLFDDIIQQPATGGTNALALPVNRPTSVEVSPRTGDFWIAIPVENRVVRFPSYDRVFANPTPNGAIASAGPLAVRVDSTDNVLIADAASRLALHFPTVTLTNAASGFQRLTPAMISTMYLQAASPEVVANGVVNSEARWPAELGDIQVLINDVPAPMLYTFPRQLAFQIPKATPTGQFASVVVQRRSTGQILGHQQVFIDVASPSFFTTNQAGTGNVAAFNVFQDGTRSINSLTVSSGTPATGPARPGTTTIEFYLTGFGNIPGLPDDGVAPTGPVPTPTGALSLFTIGGQAAEVLYSGAAPGLVGVWQINARVPATAAAIDGNVPVAFVYRAIPSNRNPINNTLISTTVAVRP